MITALRKREKVTFGHVVIFGIFFLIADAFVALTSYSALLVPLGMLEGIAMVALIARATWDSLPKSVQKGLKKLNLR